jgi:glucokinase
MILAGEIGATRTRLAAFETEGNRLQSVVEKDYPSQQHDGLSGILADFIKTEGIPVHSACLGVAGPVRAGRSKISNLPWVIDAREVAKQLRLTSVGLLNDLEAFAYGIDGLESKVRKTLKAIAPSSPPRPDWELLVSTGMGSGITLSPAKAGTPTLRPATNCKWNCWLTCRKNMAASVASEFSPVRESRIFTTFYAMHTKPKNRNGCEHQYRA